MDFLSRQKKLQAEAKLALAMAKPMAKMQVEVEKQNRKKSPVADLVSVALCNNVIINHHRHTVFLYFAMLFYSNIWSEIYPFSVPAALKLLSGLY